jgi:hypothetical protein
MKCPFCGVGIADRLDVCSKCGCEIHTDAAVGADELLANVRREYDAWEKTPPNIINKTIGALTAPVAYLLNPVMKRAAPLLEGVISGANNYIAAAIDAVSGKIPVFEDMDEKNFSEWFTEADINARNWRTAGLAAMATEGGALGAGGVFLILADIPVSFGIIMGFANKIALSYGLPIKTEEIQIAILKAISAGTANNIKEKAAAAYTMRVTDKTLQEETWQQMYKMSLDNVLSTEKLIAAVREILKKMGVTITKKKATQLLPALGAAMGAGINAAWAADALEAVRQYSRQWAVENYVKHNGGN